MAKLHLKPQDIVVLLRVLTWPGESWTYDRLGESLQMSSSHAYYALQRAEFCRLYDVERDRIRKGGLHEFLVHGIRYAFAVHRGTSERGIPTAHSASWAEDHLAASASEDYVWPHPTGTHRGLAVEPLYKSVPDIVGAAPELHDLLAMVDTLRLGSRRERDVAGEVIATRLGINK